MNPKKKTPKKPRTRAVKTKAHAAKPRRLDASLSDPDALYRTLAEAAQDMIYIVDRQGIALYTNSYGARLFGRPPEEIIGQRLQDLLDSELYEHQKKIIASVLESGNPLFTQHKVKLYSREVWLDNSLVPLRDAQGDIYAVMGIARDVSAHRQTVEALKESEDKFKYVFDHSVVGKSITLPSGEIHANKALCEMLGYPTEELNKKRWQDISHPDDLDISQKVVASILSGEKDSGRFTKRYVHKNGSFVWADVVTSLRRDGEGKPLYFMTVVSDITERKRMEEALRENEEKFRTVADYGVPGIGIAQGGKIIYANRSLAEMFGYGPEELVGSDMLDLAAPEDHGPIREFREKRIRGDAVPNRYEFKGIRKDGGKIDIEVSSGPAVPLDGIPSIIAIMQDISERKKIEEALRENEEKYRTLVERARDGILIIQDGVIQYANPKLGLASGYEAGEIQGKRFTQFVHPTEVPNVVDRFRRRLAGEEIPAIYEMTLLRKDGSKFPVEINAGVISYQGKPADLVVVRDLTERRQAEESHREQERFLASVIASIQDGISILDPELRILSVNPTMEQWFAHAMPLVGKKCYAVFYGLTEPCEFCPTRRTLETGRPAYEVVPRRGKDGEVVGWLDLYSFPRMNPVTKEFEGVIEYTRDITERKWAEEKVLESELQHRTTLDSMGDAIHVVGRDLRLVLLNERFKGWCRELGLETEVIGRTVFEAFPFLPPTVSEEYEQVFRTGATLVTEEASQVGEREIITETRKIPILQGGEVAQVVTVVHDITNRKRAEEALRKNYEHQSLILQTIPVVFYTAAPTSDLPTTWISDQIQAITGFSPRQFTEEPWFWTSRIHPDDHERVLREYEVVLTKGSVNVEYRWQVADGAYRWFLDNAVLARDAQGQPQEVNGIWVDITERKRAEEELRTSVVRLRQTLWETIEAMALIVERRDPYTAGHQRRVTLLAQAIAEEMGLSEENIQALRMAGLIHDIGKISVPSEILSKPTPLSDIEFSIIKTHVQVGFDIMKTIEFPWPVAPIVAQHHERMDGSGYPKGLQGKDIFIEARILAVADVIEAMSSYRPYRPAPGLDKALEEITRNRDLLYDPQVVDACLKLFSEKGFSFEPKEEKG